MTFLGLEQPVAYGRLLVFDPTTAQMVLNANRDYINAVYNDYLQSQLEMKEFNKEYGDFFSPIQKDMEWYENNVTGRIRNFIKDLYARGIDPLRSFEGRAAVSRELATMDTKGISLVRLSAETARLFLAAELDLRRKGLYDPILAGYEGPSLSEYSTMGDENTEAMGVWGRTSPTPILNIATFGNPYFEGMKPNIHRRSRNGIEYTEESITMDDLKAIANSKFNELVSTPLGQLMYKRYKDLTGSDEAAREMFNEAVANAQQRRTYVKDDYDDNWVKHRQLALQAESNALARDKFNWEKEKYNAEHGNGPRRNPEDFSIGERWLNKGMANAWSKDGITKNWTDMPDLYGDFGRNVDKVFHDYGKRYVHKASMNDLVNFALGQGASENEAVGARIISEMPRNKRTRELQIALDKFNEKWTKKYYDSYASNQISSYERAFSIPMAAEDVVTAIGVPVSGNSRVALITDANIDKIYSVDDVVTGTAGYTRRRRTEKTLEIRDKIKEYGADHVTATPLETGYGSLRKSTGAFDVMPKIRIKITDDKGNVVYEADAYHKIADFTESTPGGAYNKDYKEIGGTTQYGTPGLHWDKDENRFVPNDVRYQVRPQFSTRTFNMYPSYNNWLSYGGWDTEISKDNYNAGSPGKSAAW